MILDPCLGTNHGVQIIDSTLQRPASSRMDPITSFMQRRRGLDSTVSYNRDQAMAFRRSGRIGGIRNTSTDAMGRRVAMPTSAQISGGTAPASFYRSQAPTRADNVRASMLDGTFGAKRAAFNAGSKGSQMDAYGNIIPGASSPPPAPAAPAAPPQAAVPPASKTSQAPAYKPPQLPAGPLSPTGRIKDESGDITGKIMGSMADRAKASKAPLASAANPAPAAPAPVRPVDPALIEKRGFSRSMAR